MISTNSVASALPLAMSNRDSGNRRPWWYFGSMYGAPFLTVAAVHDRPAEGGPEGTFQVKVTGPDGNSVFQLLEIKIDEWVISNDSCKLPAVFTDIIQFVFIRRPLC
jgi:hypothetical protein